MNRTSSGLLLFSLMALGITGMPISKAGDSESSPPEIVSPIARVAKLEVKPTIDGILDEIVWKQTIAIQDFQTFGVNYPAMEPTEIRFGYDDVNLYISGRCDESLLITANQTIHEVKTAAKSRDENVFGDDSVTLILYPHGGDNGFEFSVNAEGVIADASSKRSSLWKARDFNWNSETQSAAKINEGFWTFEMSIPWSDLGKKKPVEGDKWDVVLARLARGRDEFVSWNPTAPVGVHSPEHFGQLILGATQVGFQKGIWKPLEPGKNQLEVDFSPGREGSTALIVSSQLAGNEGTTSARNKITIGNLPQKETWEMEARGQGTQRFGWSVREASTLSPLYVSPTISTEVSDFHSILTLSTSGIYKVYANGTIVAQGAGADDAKIRIPLRQGRNALAVEVESGCAELALNSPGTLKNKAVWRMAPTSQPKALSKDCDDRHWEVAPELSQDEKGDTMIGRTGQSMVLRHTLLVNQTRIWPIQNREIYLATGAPQFITFTAQGIPEKNLDHWKVDIRVPAFLEVKNVSGFYGNHVSGKAKYSLEKLSPNHTGDSDMATYRVSADQSIKYRPDAHPLMQIFILSVVAAERKPTGLPEDTFLEISSTANDGTVTENSQQVSLKFLPKLEGRQPQQLTWELWGSFGPIDSEEVRRDILQTSQASGFNVIVSGDRWTSEVGKEFGIRNHLNVYFKPSRIDLVSFLKEHPDSKLIDQAGEPSDFLMCTSQLLEEGWPAVSAVIKEFIKERSPDVVSYDYEYPPLVGPHSCYCERCLTAFRGFAKIADGEILDPTQIETKYRAAWVDFMARRVARLLRLMKDAVNESSPGRLFSVYSGYQTEDNSSRYGVDWRYVADRDAVDVVACGYGRPVEAVEKTIALFKGKPVICGELLHPVFTRPNLEKVTNILSATKATLLRRALDATGGVLVYDRVSMDGRSWYAVSETTRLVADYESTFLRHQLESFAEFDPAAVQLLRGDDKVLLCVMNQTSREKEYAFRLPEELGPGREYYNKSNAKSGDMVKFTLPAGESAVYIFDNLK